MEKDTMQVYVKGQRAFHTNDGILYAGKAYTVSRTEGDKLIKNYPDDVIPYGADAAKPAAPAAASTPPAPEQKPTPQPDVKVDAAKDAREKQLQEARDEFADRKNVDSMNRKELEAFVNKYGLETIKVGEIKTNKELKHVIGKVLNRKD